MKLETHRQKTVAPNMGAPVVHCSAGVGRSGTFIAIDAALALVEHLLTKVAANEADVVAALENALDIYSCVRRMREQRTLMVQTLEQYQFIHWALEYALTAMEDVRSANLHVALALHDADQ